MKNWERLRFAVICVVTVVWAVNFFAAALFESYEADPAINTVFMTIVGSLFIGGEIAKKLKAPGQKSDELEDNDEAEKDRR